MMQQKNENQIFVLNGWASSADAWSLCSFMNLSNVRLFSCRDQLDGEPEKVIENYGSVILIGWSMGASSALRLYVKYPNKIKALVLLAPTARMMEEKETNWIGMSSRRLKVFEIGLKMTNGEGFLGIPEGLPNPYQMDDEDTLKDGLLYLEKTDLRNDLEALVKRTDYCEIPVFIFHSEKDGIVRPQNSNFLKEKIFPNAELSWIKGSEHALPIYIPKEIDDVVNRLIGE